jgi:hypothetical protein
VEASLFFDISRAHRQSPEPPRLHPNMPVICEVHPISGIEFEPGPTAQLGSTRGHLTELAAIQQQQHQNRFLGYFAVPIQERLTTNTGIGKQSRAFQLNGYTAQRIARASSAARVKLGLSALLPLIFNGINVINEQPARVSRTGASIAQRHGG